MAPWEEALYFDRPAVTVTTLNPGASGQFLTANSMRVAVILSVNTGAGGMAIRPLSAPTAIGQGLLLVNTMAPQVWTFKDLGNLVMLDWYAFAVGAAVICAVETRLLKWPTGFDGNADKWQQLARTLGLQIPGVT